jgi:hypothetical protein
VHAAECKRTAIASSRQQSFAADCSVRHVTVSLAPRSRHQVTNWYSDCRPHSQNKVGPLLWHASKNSHSHGHMPGMACCSLRSKRYDMQPICTLGRTLSLSQADDTLFKQHSRICQADLQLLLYIHHTIILHTKPTTELAQATYNMVQGCQHCKDFTAAPATSTVVSAEPADHSTTQSRCSQGTLISHSQARLPALSYNYYCSSSPT